LKKRIFWQESGAASKKQQITPEKKMTIMEKENENTYRQRYRTMARPKLIKQKQEIYSLSTICAKKNHVEL